MYYDGVVFKPSLGKLYLEHHGIKGQKWGVEHGPPYPLGSAQSTGKAIKKDAKPKKVEKSKLAVKSGNKKLQDYAQKKAKEKSDYEKAREAGDREVAELARSKEREDQRKKFEDNKSGIKHPLTSESIRKPTAKETATIKEATKIKKESFFDKKRKENVEKYKSMGYTEEQANALYDDKMRTYKTVAIIGGVAITGLAAYSIYKGALSPSKRDFVIKEGSTIQSLTREGASKLNTTQNRGGLYATFTKSDRAQYMFTFGGDEKTGFKNIALSKANKNINVASTKNARKAFEELYNNNSEFKNLIDARNKDKSYRHGSRAWKSTNGSMKQMYESFNYAIPQRFDSSGKLIPNDGKTRKGFSAMNKPSRETQIFFDHMKSKGYGAILDWNDAMSDGKTSGLFAHKPVIIFDHASLSNQIVRKNEKLKVSMLPDSSGKRLWYSNRGLKTPEQRKNQAMNAYGAFIDAKRELLYGDAFKKTRMQSIGYLAPAAILTTASALTYDKLVENMSKDEKVKNDYTKRLIDNKKKKK